MDIANVLIQPREALNQPWSRKSCSRRAYAAFNARDMDGALAMHEDVIWANGMDGGNVYGREAGRAYWSNQWTVMPRFGAPATDPVELSERCPGR